MIKLSQLTNGTTLNDTINLIKQSGTLITLNTAQQYVEKNIALTIAATSATPQFNGGALNDKDATATFTNASTSLTNTSGIQIQTHGTASRDNVLYNGAVNGWVNVENNTIASPALTSSTWNGTTYYLTGVTLTNGKSFNITVPNGDNDTVTLNFTVDANGNTTIINLDEEASLLDVNDLSNFIIY